ncbi:two-component sensor histidine kinase [Paenibacillus selenitireducens]|uniref:Two-component sensor histidine kinase n=1 Tax=Paenibacillus selenitireducens TaxID=1324314 RepID=A0A1T2XMJ8_9BACL|nr:sensor histidine kinase [Paenibacillus selenitireducens]OPA81035.1 two-component sensor histidine kinase [Paenibacillus selenitireducens]
MEISRGIEFIRRRVKSKSSLFTKMNGLIIILFIPIILMYSYSNDVAFNAVSKELQKSNTRQLAFLSSQIDSRINQMMDFTFTFSKDPNVQKFNGLHIWEDRYDRMQTRYNVQEKMVLQSGVNNIWPVRYTVFSQQNKEQISNFNNLNAYNEAYLTKNVSAQWEYRYGQSTNSDVKKAFYWVYTDSFGQQGKLRGSNLVIEASFSQENIQNMLDTYKGGGQGEPFFYHKGEAPILNRSASTKLTNEIIHYLDKEILDDSTEQVVRLAGKEYLVSSIKSPLLDWHLVDVVPLGQVLGPISYSRNLFYFTMVLLFVVGLSASILLYRNVQRPIKKLIQGLQRVKRGDFSARINSNENNEFSFLFRRFNDMSIQIQDLIENVYNEKLRAREATLKQLQAQINPHFLYNCLGYIINMAQMKEQEAVVSMAYNLSAYYRYTTRMEREIATLREELQLLINYLDIQKLRNGRIDYHIDIPEDMMNHQVPRLLLQPIVENAVIHGVGKSYTSGEIRISGKMYNDYCQIFVDDDGPGLSPEGQEALNRKMKDPLQEEMGCGLWNTNQRVIHQFGENSYICFKKSPLGGFRTEILWQIPRGEQGAQDFKTQGET